MADTQTIAADKLAQLTGYTAPELTKLAGRGYFPKLVGGNYLLTPAVTGCFKARKEQAEAAGGLPVFESMAQCSAATGVPRLLLKAAKKAGVFKAHRIPLAPLLAWLFAKEGGETDAIERLNVAKADREEIRLAKDREQVLDKSEVKAALLKGTAQFFAALHRRSTSDLPPALKGLAEVEIQKRLLESDEELKKAMRSEFEKLLGSPPSSEQKQKPKQKP